MASIQQSVNQALMSAQIGGGLYAHTPMGKKTAALQELRREEKGLRERIDIEGRALDGPEDEAKTEKIYKDYTRHLKGLSRIGKERYKLDPSEEAYESMIRRQQEVEDWKETLKELKDLGGTPDGE